VAISQPKAACSLGSPNIYPSTQKPKLFPISKMPCQAPLYTQPEPKECLERVGAD